MPMRRLRRKIQGVGGSLRRMERCRAERNASGISRRDDSTSSYKKARSPNPRIGRIFSKTSNRYSSSSAWWTVGSSAPVDEYRPRPLRLRSPSRTRRVNANVMEERLQSGSAVMISRADTAWSALATYSYTRWIADLVSSKRPSLWSIDNTVILSVDHFLPGEAR